MGNSPSSQFQFNEFNNLVKNAASSASCGPDCKKQQQANILKQNYLDAQNNLNTAPLQLTNAEREYLLYTQGTIGYNKFIETKLSNEATKITNDLQNKFDNNYKETSNLVDLYNNILINYINVDELHKKYQNENKKLERRVQHKNSTAITTERKCYKDYNKYCCTMFDLIYNAQYIAQYLSSIYFLKLGI